MEHSCEDCKHNKEFGVIEWCKGCRYYAKGMDRWEEKEERVLFNDIKMIFLKAQTASPIDASVRHTINCFKQRIKESLEKANWRQAQGSQRVTDEIDRSCAYEAFKWILE